MGEMGESDEMIRRVANAILEQLKREAEAANAWFSREEGWADVDANYDGRFNSERVARAAIAAMREPIGDMLSAAGNVDSATSTSTARQIWETMIDQALKP